LINLQKKIKKNLILFVKIKLKISLFFFTFFEKKMVKKKSFCGNVINEKIIITIIVKNVKYY